jgi:polyisoprenoid-binding protein YceI
MPAKKLALASGLGMIALVVVAAGYWWFFVREDAQLATEPAAIPANLAATQTPSAAAPADAAAEDPSNQPAGGGLAFRVVAESSEAAYFADEELARVGLPSTAKGATRDVEGVFYLTADGRGLDPDRASTFTVGLTTLMSDEDRRDRRVQEALETGAFPTATFTVTGVSGVDALLAADAQQAFQMTGILDLHGVQREIIWEVEARREGGVVTALATTTFNFADFDIVPPNIAGFVTVGEDVTLQVQIIAQATG